MMQIAKKADVYLAVHKTFYREQVGDHRPCRYRLAAQPAIRRKIIELMTPMSKRIPFFFPAV